MIEDIYPHSMAQTTEELDQEFNCYFVAKTRAKKGLFMTRSTTHMNARTQRFEQTTRSPFINKELKELMKLGTVGLSTK